MKSEIVSSNPKVQYEIEKGNLYIYYAPGGAIVVLATGEGQGDSFPGVKVYDEEFGSVELGDYYSAWVKSLFQPFTGQILLEQ